MLLVLAATTVLPHVPPARRGLASGLIFTGVGLGIAASGLLVSALLAGGLAAAWTGLGALASLLTALAWSGWPDDWPRAGPTTRAATSVGQVDAHPPALRALLLTYALNAVGLVPHMVFLADFIARGLHQGVEVGARYWVLFGLGAVAGPVLAGGLADRVGFRGALRLALLVQAIGVALPAISSDPGDLVLSSLIVGAFTPGIVPLVLGRSQELASPEPHARAAAWGSATAAFALGQAVAAYGFSLFFACAGGAYVPLFVLGAAAFLLSLLVDLRAAAAEIGCDLETARCHDHRCDRAGWS